MVTGANKGLGREIARRLAAEGMIVYLGARDEKRGRAAAEDLGAEGADVRFLRLDVTDQAQIDAAVARLEAETGRLDVLVNNAGILLELQTPETETGGEQLRETFAVNLIGAIAVTQASIPLLRRSAPARIVNMSTPLGSLSLIPPTLKRTSRRWVCSATARRRAHSTAPPFCTRTRCATTASWSTRRGPVTSPPTSTSNAARSRPNRERGFQSSWRYSEPADRPEVSSPAERTEREAPAPW